MSDTPLYLRKLWYMAGLSSSLKPGTMRREMLCGEPVLLARTPAGQAMALRDICPHRAAPLSAGWFKDDRIVCPYHGWQFGADGGCKHIPSLLEDQDFDVTRIRVRSYPLREQDGLIWVYMPAADEAPALEPTRVPLGPADGKAVPRFVEIMPFPCEVDHAVVGLMDPAHGPFVHRAWFWRNEASIHAKAKHHTPSERGFNSTILVNHFQGPCLNSRSTPIRRASIHSKGCSSQAIAIPSLRNWAKRRLPPCGLGVVV